jgi:hypothetical protein
MPIRPTGMNHRVRPQPFLSSFWSGSSFSSGTSDQAHCRIKVHFRSKRIPAAALTGMFHGVEHPRHARDHSILLRALSMKRHGLNSGDPVCRPIRLSLSSYVPGLRCQPLKSNAPGVQGNAAALISGSIPCAQASRFRLTFQVLFCWGPMPSGHDFLATAHDLLTTSARGTPLRSGRGGSGARPAAAKSAATAGAWPAPNSTTTAPPGASSAGAVAAICR